MMAAAKPPGCAKGRSSRPRAGTKHSVAQRKEDAAQRKAALEAAIRKKIEFEKKALYTVEQLLEENITEEFLVNSGKLITPSHYKDIVDERSIIRLCGYPLCQNKLENVPKQKYRISTKTNRVYDITERKCFCSNFCYRASKYFEAQISKSPVWMREEEKPPDIELLKEGQSGQSGEEVKLCDEVIKASDIENPRASSDPCESGFADNVSDSSSDTEQEFVSSVLPGSRSSSANLAQQLYRKSIPKKKPFQRVYSSPKNEDLDVTEATEQLSRCKLDAQEEMHAYSVQNKITVTPSENTIPGKSNTTKNYENTCSDSQIVFLSVSKKGEEQLKRMLASSKELKKYELRDPVNSLAAKGNLLGVLKQTFMEWRTEETLKFLYGSNYTSLCSSECTSAANHENEELDEDDLDEPDDLSVAAAGSENSLNQSLPFRGSGGIKPVPSYEKLKEETEFLELRVKEFYKGKCILAEEAVAQAGIEEHHSKDKDVLEFGFLSFLSKTAFCNLLLNFSKLDPDHLFGYVAATEITWKKIRICRLKEVDQQQDLTFPLVDSNAQMQIRKRIVLEKLRKALPAVLGPLQITLGDIYTELKNLVKTFRLTNRNIIHKMPEWTLIAIVLLSALSHIIPVFRNTEKSPVYTQFLSTLLEELHFKNEDLESLTRIFRKDNLPEWNWGKKGKNNVCVKE